MQIRWTYLGTNEIDIKKDDFWIININHFGEPDRFTRSFIVNSLDNLTSLITIHAERVKKYNEHTFRL